jgi:tetratricopeptide (TPR) repeat protein
MNGRIIYFIGVGLIAVGTILTYWGSNLKSEESTKVLKTAISEKNSEIDNLGIKVSELIDGKDTLLQQNQELKSEIGRYQTDLNEKEKTIQELEKQAKKAMRGISSTYDFNGAKRITTRPGHISLEVGPEVEIFNKINELEKQRNYPELKNICEQQIIKTPEWLTPYLYLGLAYANMDNKEKAIEMFEYVLNNAPDDPAYAQAKEFLKKLK